MDIKETFTKPLLGMLGISTSLVVSMSDRVEQWMRMIALGLGYVVAGLTIYSLFLSIRRKIRRERKIANEGEPDSETTTI